MNDEGNESSAPQAGVVTVTIRCDIINRRLHVVSLAEPLLVLQILGDAVKTVAHRLALIEQSRNAAKVQPTSAEALKAALDGQRPHP